jgi:hypothetical protein
MSTPDFSHAICLIKSLEKQAEEIECVQKQVQGDKNTKKNYKIAGPY